MTPPGRRARVRAETTAEIKQAALDQISDVGAPSLSLRAVGRAIGMSPAGLYRYYDGRNALLTALITDAYNELADRVEAATTDDGRTAWERFEAGVRAYGDWGRSEPNRFLLIFGTPVPGYAAPEDGPTVAANRRMGEAFFRVAAEAWRHGQLTPPDPERDPTEGERELAEEIAASAPGFPATLVPALMGAWAHWHGLVLLEITGQLHWIYGDDPKALWDVEIERMLDSLGAVPE